MNYQLAVLFVLLILVCWNVEYVISRGGRGGSRGGGYRGSSYRGGGSTSRTSRGGYGGGYYDTRYPSYRYRGNSLGWKTGAVAGGSIFMGYYFASQFNHRYSEFNNRYTNSICYNVSYANFTNDNFKKSGLNDGTVEPTMDIPRGLFICPLSLAELDKAYCCGPPEGEHCCTYSEISDSKLSSILTMAALGLFFLVIFCWLYPKIRKSQLGRHCCARNNENPAVSGVVYDPNGAPLLPAHVSGGSQTQWNPNSANLSGANKNGYSSNSEFVPPYNGYPSNSESIPPYNSGYPPNLGVVPSYNEYPPGTGSVPPYNQYPSDSGSVPPYNQYPPGTGSVPPVTGSNLPNEATNVGWNQNVMPNSNLPPPSYNDAIRM